MQEVLRALLESEGYEVTTAVDGEEALDLLRDGAAPSLIVLDLMLPRMDGFQFRALQRANPAWAIEPQAGQVTNENSIRAMFCQRMENTDFVRLLNPRRGKEDFGRRFVGQLHRVAIFADVLKVGAEVFDAGGKDVAELSKRATENG